MTPSQQPDHNIEDDVHHVTVDDSESLELNSEPGSFQSEPSSPDRSNSEPDTESDSESNLADYADLEGWNEGDMDVFGRYEF